MSIVIPDIDWYLEKSRTQGSSTPRCPHATVDACPRYFQSLALLGNAGCTEIAPKERYNLKKKWGKSDLWPKTGEQETSISGSNGRNTQFSNFCPEVTFEIFGYFASKLGRYIDEIDQDIAYKRLGEMKPLKNDWRGTWAYIQPQHYSECPLYSILSHRGANLELDSQNQISKAYTPGDYYDFFRDLKEIIARAKQQIFVIDPYFDGKAFDTYLSEVRNPQIRILTQRYSNDVKIYADKHMKQYGTAIELRKSKKLHDRLILIDSSECWITGGSVKDGGEKPAYLIPVEPQMAEVKRDIYLEIWNQACPLNWD